MAEAGSAHRLIARSARAALALLLGMATTALVSWALACKNIGIMPLESAQQIFPKRGEVYLTSMGGDANELSVRLYEAFGRTVIKTQCNGPEAERSIGSPFYIPSTPSKLPPDELVPMWAREMALPWFFGEPWPRGGDRQQRTIEGSGWPMIALACERVRLPNYTTGTRFGIELSRKRDLNGYWPNEPCRLPLRPLLKGFALDSALYAAAWLVLILAPPSLVRFIRHRPGRCAKCRYDLAGLSAGAPCPECGTPRIP